MRVLRARGLRDAATILWNANNTYGFDRIDFGALQRAAAITTVSKYMKFELALRGVGVARRFRTASTKSCSRGRRANSSRLRAALRGKPSLVKVGRFDPDKNWLQAIDAVAELRAMDLRAAADRARRPRAVRRGRVRSARAAGCASNASKPTATTPKPSSRRSPRATPTSFISRRFLPEATLAALYAACDAVLANSGKEPFGLVGLEVMAAGGIPVCGSTGEEYAEPFHNAIVCDTDDGRELAEYLRARTATSARGPHAPSRLRDRDPLPCGRTCWKRWPRSSPTSRDSRRAVNS
jgi:glycosyltransferase involved in cell wall biosynthesis